MEKGASLAGKHYDGCDVTADVRESENENESEN